MRHLILSCLLALLAAAAPAQEPPAGNFDYYLLSLGWSPSWCATEGAGRDAAQCARGAGRGWVLHGLWPQNEDGSYPSFCTTDRPGPSRRQAAAMADLMGSASLARYQWRKHGSCSGLTGGTYLGAARLAFRQLHLPPAFQRLTQDIRLPASLVEEAFLAANPQLSAEALNVTCKAGRIQEVRICLTRRLEPRPCGTGANRDCQMSDALMEAVP